MLTELMLPADVLTFLPGLLVLVLDSRVSSEMCIFSTHKQNILREKEFHSSIYTITLTISTFPFPFKPLQTP